MTLRLARVALGIALVLTALFTFSLPVPPRTVAERVAAVVLLCALLAELVAFVRLPRRTTVVRGLVYTLGAYGAVTLGRWALLLVQGSSTMSPASALLACMQAAALIAAAIAVIHDQAKATAARRPA